ncbi:hypothetical protein ACFV5G_34700 [Streptomyces sp. NPDC059766]|uniref:hypothetical protein n=1 Tax=Streptomyces sp. NPDC059766 TaxID=3346940 RepID=UPI003654BC87
MNVRLLALAGVVAGAAALPLAMASAGQVGLTSTGRPVVRPSTDGEAAGAAASDASASGGSGSDASASGDSDSSGAAGSPGAPGVLGATGLMDPADSTNSAGSTGSAGDAKEPYPDPRRSPLVLGLGLATAARCGPELTSPDGIEAQTCVMTQGEDTWARTYYRNATGGGLGAALSLMGPAGRTVQIDCAVGTDDEPGICETPREPTRGVPDAYTAVAEFAGPTGRGPLLLRSGSNAEGSAGRTGGDAPGSGSGPDAGGNSGSPGAG